jgi:hypothetical protein
VPAAADVPAAAAAALRPGEQLAEAVSAEVQRQRFEALFSSHTPAVAAAAAGAAVATTTNSSSSSSSSSASTSAHLLHHTATSSSSSRQPRQGSVTSAAVSSSSGHRDLGTPGDDELLPLLADVATHPFPPHDRQQQLQHDDDGGGAPRRQQPPPAPSANGAAPVDAAAAAAAAADVGGADADAARQQQQPEMIGGGIPRSIFVLSMVSMALTSASCVFNTLLPIYMVAELKMTMRTMGMFEGRRACACARMFGACCVAGGGVR